MDRGTSVLASTVLERWPFSIWAIPQLSLLRAGVGFWQQCGGFRVRMLSFLPVQTGLRFLAIVLGLIMTKQKSPPRSKSWRAQRSSSAGCQTSLVTIWQNCSRRWTGAIMANAFTLLSRIGTNGQAKTVRTKSESKRSVTKKSIWLLSLGAISKPESGGWNIRSGSLLTGMFWRGWVVGMKKTSNDGCGDGGLSSVATIMSGVLRSHLAIKLGVSGISLCTRRNVSNRPPLRLVVGGGISTKRSSLLRRISTKPGSFKLGRKSGGNVFTGVTLERSHAREKGYRGSCHVPPRPSHSVGYNLGLRMKSANGRALVTRTNFAAFAANGARAGSVSANYSGILKS